MDYSEYRLEREGKRSQDSYMLSYEPKDGPCGVQERLAPWIANLVKAVMLEKCPGNVKEHEYGYRRERNESDNQDA